MISCQCIVSSFRLIKVKYIRIDTVGFTKEDLVRYVQAVKYKGEKKDINVLILLKKKKSNNLK